MSQAKPPGAIYLKMLGVTLAWAGTLIPGRIIATSLPHCTAAAVRFMLATIALFFVLYLREGGLPRLNLRQWMMTALVGATGAFAYNIAFFAALERIPASRAALVVTLSPIVTALAMALLFKESLPARAWAGVVLALGGVWIVLSKGDLAHIGTSVGLGEFAMFSAVCLWAVSTILSRSLLAAPDAPSPLLITLLMCAWGTVFLGIAALFEMPEWRSTMLTLQAGASVAYLGLLGTALAFVWYNEGVHAIGPSRATIFNNLVPVFGVALSAIFLGETISNSMLLGGAITMAGVAMTNIPKRG